jgi:hypothetical protein
MPLGVPVQTRGETLPKKLKSLIDNVELVLFPPQAYILNIIAEVTFDKEDKLSGETVSVISLFPKTPSKSDFHTIVLYIGKADNELKKAKTKRF